LPGLVDDLAEVVGVAGGVDPGAVHAVAALDGLRDAIVVVHGVVAAVHGVVAGEAAQLVVSDAALQEVVAAVAVEVVVPVAPVQGVVTEAAVQVVVPGAASRR